MGSFLKRDLAASKRFKAKLTAREITTLINSNHPSPSLVEALAHIGFDGVLIEAEHGSVGRERVEEMSRAAALAGAAALIRPEASLPYLLTSYYGCSVDGFMLPLIRSVMQAQQLVDAFRYSAPTDFQDRPLIFMIEHIDAINCLPELLRIDGVDAFLLAKDDLALSFGEKIGDNRPYSKRVLETIDWAIDTIVDAGKVCGARVTFEDVGRLVSKGVTLVYEHTNHMIASGAKNFMSHIAAAKK